MSRTVRPVPPQVLQAIYDEEQADLRACDYDRPTPKEGALALLIVWATAAGIGASLGWIGLSPLALVL